MPTLISYDAHTRNALGSVEITTAEQIPALISESQKTQKNGQRYHYQNDKNLW